MLVWSAYLVLACAGWLSDAKDTIRPNEVLTENETLVSAGGVFELGFFQDAVFGNVFLGIWFKNTENKKPVWVANRDIPLEHLYATFQIRYDGNLIVIDRRQAPTIVNYGMLATSLNTSATLLDTGNLILRQGDEIIWQSFDFPTDTFLPGMKLGWFCLQADQQRIQVLLSWLNPQNPSRGTFTMGTGYKDARNLAVWKRDISHIDIGSLEGNGFRFIFKTSFKSFNLSYSSTENETYLTFSTTGGYDMSWLVVTSTGHLDEYALYKGRLSLVHHSICDTWKAVNSSMCSKEASQKCVDGDTFVVNNGSLPSSLSLNVSVISDFDDCELMCQTNCSCIAFAFGESGCQLYFGSTTDLFYNISGHGEFRVRSNAIIQHHGRKKRRLIIIVLVCSITPTILAILILGHYRRCRKHICRVNQLTDHGDSSTKGGLNIIVHDAKIANTIAMRTINDLEFSREEQKLSWFCISTIENATRNFDTENKLGEGGFGPVHKGKLPSGQEIAVKRLSKRSVQGVKEFKNEATLISRLQHKNLVRLLGCCIQGDEYILVYEYLINRSLDSFIFNESKQIFVDWKKRIQIIEGIAQGILYLHKYSRLKIIHRDLKTSNILLDGDMNPKISDFGMARIYGESDTRAKTTKIAGTYGYMSPEYAMDGHFSEKSDVFSFGIIVLETISGKRNISFFEADLSLNLLGYAWKLWKEGRSIEFLDSSLSNSCTISEAAKYIQLGLLCVQERAADRPTMSNVVDMVRNDVACLPQPKEPAFLS